MSQRFRRNIAPVLGALALFAAGIGVWALLGVQQTRQATAELHARFHEGAAPWAVALPADGYAVFDYRRDDGSCVTLSLLPEAATLLTGDGEPRSVARADAATLADEVAALAAGCDRVAVRVFASRIPYHGRFTVRYADASVTRVSEPEFGD